MKKGFKTSQLKMENSIQKILFFQSFMWIFVA